MAVKEKMHSTGLCLPSNEEIRLRGINEHDEEYYLMDMKIDYSALE